MGNFIVARSLTKHGIEKKCEKLWGEIVIRRAKYTCEYPGCKRSGERFQMHPHHYYPRGNKSTIWEPINGICLCALHHTLGNDAAHQDPDFKDKFLNGVNGYPPSRDGNWLEELIKIKNIIIKYNYGYLEVQKIRLERMLKEIMNV